MGYLDIALALRRLWLWVIYGIGSRSGAARRGQEVSFTLLVLLWERRLPLLEDVSQAGTEEGRAARLIGLGEGGKFAV